MTKLILDLQGNPGGYMDQAIGIADEFLKKEKNCFH
ncbi:MAG: S41 family peptidase [Cytophagales bacterium]|nr:S41 family peptidase [Cytophagales bacterium]